MSFKKLEIKRSYTTGKKGQLLDKFLRPLLKESERYYRSVGYFSCSVLFELSTGLKNLIKNNGKIKIIASPNLSDEDIRLINEGYSRRDIIEKNISASIKKFDFDSMNIIEKKEDIVKLIENGILDFKICLRKDMGLYHDKLGILYDEEGNKVVFIGSPNETYSAYKKNYEKIRIFKSWSSEDSEARVKEEVEEFNKIWNNEHEDIKTYSFPESLKKEIIKRIENLPKNHPTTRREKQSKPNSKPNIVLRDYQKKAIKKWKENNYNGFFEMATGTGKTWTAIFGMRNLFLNKKNIFSVIVAPYKHLVEQWYYDLDKLFNYRLIRVSSDHNDWEVRLRSIVNLKRFDKNKNHIIILTTQASYRLKRFRVLINKITTSKLLVVDEAHRFINETSKRDLKFEYKLGLSATPRFNKYPEKTARLISYFDKVVFQYSLEEAIGKHLTNYYYYPIFVHLNEDEEKSFKKAQAKIASCFSGGKLIKTPETLGKYVRQRNRVIARCEEKEENRIRFIKDIKEKEQLIIYCGDGYVYSDSGEHDRRYIDKLTFELYQEGFRVHKFTSTESLDERMELIKDFSEGNVDMMVAIKCLDEGINVPSIKSALILASNDDSREFIQRRGRILRKYPNKEQANIYDIVVLPYSRNAADVAKIELRRYKEFARLAINQKNLMTDYKKYKSYYKLDENSNSLYDYEETVMEDKTDE